MGLEIFNETARCGNPEILGQPSLGLKEQKELVLDDDEAITSLDIVSRSRRSWGRDAYVVGLMFTTSKNKHMRWGKINEDGSAPRYDGDGAYSASSMKTTTTVRLARYLSVDVVDFADERQTLIGNDLLGFHSFCRHSPCRGLC